MSRKIELVNGNIYIYDELAYRAGKVYTVNDDVADYLLERTGQKGRPLFKEQMPKKRGPKPKKSADVALSRLKAELGEMKEAPSVAAEPKQEKTKEPVELIPKAKEAQAD